MRDEIVVATYNVHGCVGADGHFAPARILAVIRELEPDAIGLQETGAWGSGVVDQIAYLASALDYRSVAGPTHEREGGHFGNALLVRGDVLRVRTLDLCVNPRSEPRGALDVDVLLSGVAVRIVNTHLGLRWTERSRQVERLLACLGERDDTAATVVMADFNEWLPSAATLRRMHTHLGRHPAPRTFPAWRPILSLDRIWVRPAAAMLELRAHRSVLARQASDHLPVVARLSLDRLREANEANRAAAAVATCDRPFQNDGRRPD